MSMLMCVCVCVCVCVTGWHTGSVKKGRQHFTLLLTVGISIVSVILASFGLLGFFTFGDATCSIILLNMPTGVFVDIVKAMVCVGVVFTYPMQVCACRVTDCVLVCCPVCAPRTRTDVMMQYIRLCWVTNFANVALASRLALGLHTHGAPRWCGVPPSKIAPVIEIGSWSSPCLDSTDTPPSKVARATAMEVHTTRAATQHRTNPPAVNTPRRWSVRACLWAW